MTFSEPMNTASVESAYEAYTVGIFGNDVSFSWNGDNTALIIQPGADLEMNAGDETVEAKLYEWSIGGAAQDAQGTSMGSDFNADFSTPRDVTESIAYIPSLSATVLKNGPTQTTYASQCYSGNHFEGGAFTCGLTFDLDDLSFEPTLIQEANVVLYLTGVWANPYGANGVPAALWNTNLDSVANIPAPAFQLNTNKISDLFPSSTPMEGSWHVTDFVTYDWENVDNHRTQFRILAGYGDNDESNYWIFQRNGDYPSLEVNYLAD